MSQFVVCFFCFLVTHLKLAYQSQHHIDGKSGLKRAVLVKGAAQVSYGNFVADNFHRLQVSVGSSTTVMSYRECAMSCVNTPPCASFNVASSPDVDGKFLCELLNEDKYNSLNQLITSQEYHHFSIKTKCSSYPCKNNGKCVPNYGDNQIHCDCAQGYEGPHCETDIDECSSNPCSNGGTCTDQVNGYVCSCQPGYTGAQCQTNIDECSSNPCVNGGTCTDQVNGYVCTCQSGYGGARCGTNINECSSNPCLNGGTCDDQINEYVCTCQPGYTGAHCQTDINECSSNPCLNGGTCTDQVNEYVCTCQPEYTGAHCQTNINECSSNPCLNGGTCTDQINGYVCTCQPGYTGAHCQTDINECSSNPCLNGGTCADQVNEYVCTCQPEYTGAHCQTIMASACFDNAVGVADPNTIVNDQMTASSRYNNNYYGYNGRLNRVNTAWCARGCCGSQDWLQIDLGKTFQICGVATQGNGGHNEYVTDFKLSSSPDGSDWTTYEKADGSEMQFHRSGDYNQIDEHSLPVPLSTRYVRFIPTAQKNWNCLRVEVYGAAP